MSDLIEIATFEKYNQKEGDENYGVISKNRISKGDYIMQNEALICAPLDEMWNKVCRWCFSKSKLLQCSKCNNSSYCSKSCQKNHWNIHKHECGKIPKNIENYHTEALLLLAAYTLGRDDFDRLLLQKSNDISIFEYQLDSISFAKDNFSIFEDISESCLLVLCNIFKKNNFMIKDDNFVVLGVGAFILASYVNHSCSPNTDPIFAIQPGRKPLVIFQSVRDIMPGDEITHSYVNLALNPIDRKRSLEIDHGFVCKCDRCVDPNNLLDRQMLSKINGSLMSEDEIASAKKNIKKLRSMKNNLSFGLKLYKSYRKTLHKNNCFIRSVLSQIACRGIDGSNYGVIKKYNYILYQMDCIYYQSEMHPFVAHQKKILETYLHLPI